MTELTETGRQALDRIASRHGVSPEAVEHVLTALVAGQGTLAQFNHPELGGMGQWTMGGMTMIGDMFNNSLKARVDAICTDVAELMRQSSPVYMPSAFSSQTQCQGDRSSLFVSGGSSGKMSGNPSGNWWPGDLGHAASTGAQNRMRYAWFPQAQRLAIDSGDGAVRVYDTGDHRIGGFSQQQSGDQSLSFTSQHGLVKLSELREIDMPESETDARARTPKLSEALQRMPAGAGASDRADQAGYRDPEPEPAPVDIPEPSQPATPETPDEPDIFAKIERLAALHAKGILTDGEYQAKKAELLARI